MVDKNLFDRIKLWRQFREQLETAENPLLDVIYFWNNVPISSIAADPYDTKTWPDPWELLKENTYCEFTKILAIYYTLQLTDRFSQSSFEIHIVLDKKESAMKYLLFVDNQAIGYYYDKSIDTKELPNLECQMRYDVLPTY